MDLMEEIFKRLESLHPKIIDLKLDRVKKLLRKLGSPERSLPPIIHVAGTNGKGSTIAMIKAGLKSNGLKTHVYTSPHLVRFNERIEVGNKRISEDALKEVLTECEKLNNYEPITFFEITTCAAFLAFSREIADYTLLEVGLGGEFDATNVVQNPVVSVITPISFDHKEYLGASIKEIASPTVEIASALSSGICISNSFSNSIINSTVSKESAPKSFVKLASLTTSVASTPRLSTIIALTFSDTSDITFLF